jgi:protein-tyrosine phosphatase
VLSQSDRGVLRDLGGRRVPGVGTLRSGQVFRLSGGLATTDDLRRLETAGLRAVVDLRGEGEDRGFVEQWTRAAGVRYVHQPISAASPAQLAEVVRAAHSVDEAAEHLRAMYRGIVDGYGREIAATLATVSESLPAGFGCAAGKDRTGVVSAMLYAVLGVDDADIARSYATQAPRPEELRPLARAYLRLADDDPIPPGIEIMMVATEETMVATLEHVRRRHGSVQAYLERHGFSADAAATLQERLVVDAPAVD